MTRVRRHFTAEQKVAPAPGGPSNQAGHEFVAVSSSFEFARLNAAGTIRNLAVGDLGQQGAAGGLGVRVVRPPQALSKTRC